MYNQLQISKFPDMRYHPHNYYYLLLVMMQNPATKFDLHKISDLQCALINSNQLLHDEPDRMGPKRQYSPHHMGKVMAF